jgi:arylsulfatase A-like enzyme
VITDDQGYGDLSYYGNPLVETPNMDLIAEQSVRFSDFHVDPTCAPTRAALMTGKYAHRVGVWHTISGGNHLRATELTMADVFKQAGYNTALFGKWHLGSNYPYRPMDRGFDEWLGQGDGGTGTTDDWFDNDRVNDHYWHNGERVKRKGFATDVFFDSAINYIRQQQQQQHKNKKPFFVKLSTYLPHSPHTLPNFSLKDKFKDKVSNYVAQFLASVERIDSNIGKLESSLKSLKLTDNTIFIFMTDNGSASGVSLYNANMRGAKGAVYEGGHRVPFFIRWPNGKLQHGRDVKELTSHIDVLPTLIDLAGIQKNKAIDFDGRSFKSQLYNVEHALTPRTLFVEKQRVLEPTPWEETAGMMQQWRLVNNTELYHIGKDPSQTVNVVDKYPAIATQIRQAHKAYWQHVTPNDRDAPLTIVGHENDPETFLHPSDWQLPDAPWNHAQIAAGNPQVGEWHIKVSQPGVYRFEVRRWPKEAETPIQGIPFVTHSNNVNSSKTIDAWNEAGPITHLVYGGTAKALPVKQIKLNVGRFSQTQKVTPQTKKLIFDVSLKQGETTVKGIMIDNAGNTIAGAYYVYITRLPAK